MLESAPSKRTTLVHLYVTSHLSGVSSNSVRVKTMSFPENLSDAGSVYVFDSNVKGIRHGLMKSIVLAADAVATVGYISRG